MHTGKHGRKEKYVQVSFWDLSGDPAYTEVRSEFYKDAQALVIMCDITSQKSFDGMEMWMREVGKHGGDNVGQLPVFIVGNKMDMKNKRQVQLQTASSWAKSRDFKGYFETSAKEGWGYVDLLAEICDTCL